MKGYVLAGGASSRMGSDKARLPHHGVPTAVHLCSVLEAAGLEVTLVRRGAPDGLPWIHADDREVRVLYEPDAGSRHPLNGVHAALLDANGPVVVVPCDLPGLTTSVVRSLLDGPCVACAARVHPLVAHLPPECIDDVAALVGSGGAARELVEGLPRVVVPDATLVDRNASHGPWPVDLLRARLAWLSPQDFGRIARSERTRQRLRGVVDPSANLYASRPLTPR